jgi:hypothetical protein
MAIILHQCRQLHDDSLRLSPQMHYSPDGHYLAAITTNKEFIIWETAVTIPPTL